MTQDFNGKYYESKIFLHLKHIHYIRQILAITYSDKLSHAHAPDAVCMVVYGGHSAPYVGVCIIRPRPVLIVANLLDARTSLRSGMNRNVSELGDLRGHRFY